MGRAEPRRTLHRPHHRIARRRRDVLAAPRPTFRDQHVRPAHLAPLNRYDFLAYCLIVQGIAIHVDTHCGGTGQDGWGQNKSSSGDVLTLAAPLAGFKGTILAGRLSPHDREVLLHCFGPDYLRDSTELLTLDWLHTGRVAENLEHNYGVTFTPPRPSSTAAP